MNDTQRQWLIAGILTLIVALGLLWLWRTHNDATPEALSVPAVQPVEPTPEKNTEPQYPLPAPDKGADRATDLVPLPNLDDSDQYFALALSDVFGEDMANRLVDSALIEDLVTTVDNLPRKHLAEKIRPLRTLNTQFVVQGNPDEQRYILDPDNFKRYDVLVDMLANADANMVVATYKRFYPLLQKAYVNQGYPNGYFNDRVVEVIDSLLAAPEPDEPIALLRPNVLYEYADPKLEALSSGQKLLIRMGKANELRVKSALREFRKKIVH